ncbi:MAG: FHA domain-containing protein [Gammaproteobacteria bacterium]|nr:FHA domain-containing protein [Gammaproteobacteria bacterium]
MLEKTADKLVVLKVGEVPREVLLDAKKLAIGRDSRSNIPLKDPSVSRHHARLTKVFNDYYLEDLGSTNGTYLNDQQITKHKLKHGDRVRIGSFTLRFLTQAGDDVADDDPVSDMDQTIVIPPAGKPAVLKPLQKPQNNRAQNNTVSLPKSASVRFLHGPKKDLEDRIDRGLYTIGRPGSELAVIARRPQGFYLLHIGGARYPKINGNEISTTKGILLHEGDEISVGENKVKISFKI